MNKIFRFDADCGRMGSLDGIFVSTDEKINKLIGKTAYFGEVLGKHSDIHWIIEKSNFTELTADQDFIKKAEEYELIPVGFNPASYLSEDDDEEFDDDEMEEDEDDE